jgi:hypothetical protein
MQTRIVRAQHPATLDGASIFKIPDLDLITAFTVGLSRVMDPTNH